MRLEFADFYRELYEAAQMQRKLSGPRFLRRGDFQIAAEMFPVRHLSGDFFNVSDLGKITLLAIGDIAGKGLLAGMWFTHLLGLTRMYGESLGDPALALTAINRQICQPAIPVPMTSLFLARLDWGAHELLYCNAGHPAPILLRDSGTLQHLDEGGPVLGAVPGAKFTGGRVRLNPGDMLVGYSDGLLECRNEHEEEFGVDRVIQELSKPTGSISELLFSIIGAAQDFTGSNLREDDCTLLVVQCGQRESIAL
jgi:sigma-B regulation protein RsbU (phosphoserine phosphatase)